MVATVLAVVMSAQASPAERLFQFMAASPQRGITFTAKSGPVSIKAKLSYFLPNWQYIEFSETDARVRFLQTPDRIALFNDFEKLYYEYQGFSDFMVSPPPDSGVITSVYPYFLWRWQKPESIANAKNDGSETIDGTVVDWIKETIQTDNGLITIRTAVAASGAPIKVVYSDPVDATITYSIQEISWPYFDIKNWKYQPPLGYMLATAPQNHRPIISGAKIDFKDWGIDIPRLNKKGVAVVVTAAGSRPDEAIQPALAEMQKALDKIGVKMVEVHLDAKTAPKRGWPITLDANGAIAKQLDIPVTPYIFFVDNENRVLKAWAGYAEDQRKKLIQTAVETYQPPEDDEL